MLYLKSSSCKSFAKQNSGSIFARKLLGVLSFDNAVEFEEKLSRFQFEPLFDNPNCLLSLKSIQVS